MCAIPLVFEHLMLLSKSFLIRLSLFFPDKLLYFVLFRGVRKSNIVEEELHIFNFLINFQSLKSYDIVKIEGSYSNIISIDTVIEPKISEIRFKSDLDRI